MSAQQLSMFEQREVQRDNIERVGARVGSAISMFVATHLALQKPFTADELREYVLSVEPDTAPASPDRILRLLRQQGRLNYQVLNRAASLYEALPVADGERL